MVERVLSMHEAKGSMPFFSTFFSDPRQKNKKVQTFFSRLTLADLLILPAPASFRIELVAYGSIFLMALFRAGGPYILEGAFRCVQFGWSNYCTYYAAT
jgi:hypothetical protein